MSYLRIYQVGDRVRFRGQLQTDGTSVDPTEAYAWTYDPNGTRVEYQYGVSPEVIQDGTGSFYFDVDIDTPGDWYFGFWSTGTGKAASYDGQILVERSRRLPDWDAG